MGVVERSSRVISALAWGRGGLPLLFFFPLTNVILILVRRIFGFGAESWVY